MNPIELVVFALDPIEPLVVVTIVVWVVVVAALWIADVRRGSRGNS